VIHPALDGSTRLARHQQPLHDQNAGVGNQRSGPGFKDDFCKLVAEVFLEKRDDFLA